jgi:hypothetical protein
MHRERRGSLRKTLIECHEMIATELRRLPGDHAIGEVVALFQHRDPGL